MITDETELIIPGYDPNNPRSYPGDIKPGYYNKTKVKKLLKKQKLNCLQAWKPRLTCRL